MNKYKECNQCPHEFNDKNLEPCKDCVPKKPTNADRIRSMDDEELAEFIKELNDVCLAGTGKVNCYDRNCVDCKSIVMKWLQSEVE